MSDVMQADEIISTAPQDSTACRQCGRSAEFGYRADGEMHWYCADHQLAVSYADARRPAPVNSGTEVEVTIPHQWSLEELTKRFHRKVDEGRRLHEKMNDLQLKLGQMLLEMRQRVESGETGDLAAVDWWGWYSDAVPHVSRGQAERWMAIAAAQDPQAAALEYRDRDAGYSRAYRARRSQKLLVEKSSHLAPDGEQTTPAEEPQLLRDRPKRARLFVGHDIDESEQIENIIKMFLQLTFNGRHLLMKRIRQVYSD